MESKIFVYAVLIFLTLSIFSSTLQADYERGENVVEEREELTEKGILERSVNATLTRTPEEVASWQSAFVFANVEGACENVSLNVETTIETTMSIKNQAPIPIISSPTDGDSFFTTDLIYFDGSNSTDLDNDTLGFFWTSNATAIPAIGTTANFSRYLPAGVHLITLYVNDFHGANVSTSINITVEGVNLPPVAAFTYLPLAPQTNKTIYFTDQSTDTDGTIVAWYWEFGDGDTSIDQNPQHAYTIADTYTVNLTVTDDDGATDTVSIDIVVHEMEDTGDNFITAREVYNGTTWSEWLSASLDPNDYFKIWLNAGEGISSDLSVPSLCNFNLFLYNSTQSLVDSSENAVGVDEQVSGTTEENGYWYIQVNAVYGSGDYSITFTVIEASQVDTTPPVLHEVIVTPTTINAGENITIKINATDDLSGVRNVWANIYNASGYYYAWVSLTGDYNSTSGYYEDKYSVPQYIQGGIWNIGTIELYDNVGNYKMYFNGTDYVATFEVISEAVDTTPPVLHDVIVIPTTVSAGENITIKINATDDLSGVRNVWANIYNASGYYYAWVSLTGDYNSTSGYYEDKYSVPQYIQGGIWNIGTIELYDNVGNYKMYFNGTDYVATFEVVTGGKSPSSQKSADNICYKQPKSPATHTHSYSTRMIPISSGWYVTAIPGLPNTTVNLTHLNISVTSKVNYTLYIDGNYAGEGGYEVVARNPTNRSPIIYVSDYNVLNDTTILTETLGLGPKGWSVNASEPFKTLIIALDSKGVDLENILFYYKVGEGSWKTEPVHEETEIMNMLGAAVDNLNSFIQTINENISDGKQQLQSIILPIMVGNAIIPAQSAGTYVEFYANVSNSEGNNGSSLMGFYYVDNPASGTKILSIDPNLYCWVMQENVERLVQQGKEHSDYNIPENFTNNFTKAKGIGEVIREYGITPFRRWEYLGENYDLYIAKADEKIPELLESYQPDVIFLSNVWNGFRQMDYQEAGFWNWDLRDLGVDDDIINYTKNNHTGLIATHGTLSDWIIWSNPSEKYKVCTRGHVGDGMDDIDIEEKTIAHMLGLPTLALYEYIRDIVAEALCKGGDTYPLGLMVGSTPLQVPYIPFNGTMIRTDEANYSDWNISEEFYIEIPGYYEEINFTRKNLTAHTQIGWQLGMPRALAYAAWWKAQELKPYAQELYKNLSQLIQNITNSTVGNNSIVENLTAALDWALNKTYQAIISADITNQSFNLTQLPLNASDINATVEYIVNRTITLVWNAYETILQHLPVKLIALSKDGLAGIITHDKYWDNETGYRSVYFSFEVETAEGSTGKDLLMQAVEWSKKWEYQNSTELLGNLVRVGKDTAQKFKENATATSGTWLQNESLILNEEGNATVDLNLQDGSVSTIIIAHPTTDTITAQILCGDAEIISTQNLGNYVTKIKVKSYTTWKITIGFRANSNAGLNPAYLSVKQNRVPEIIDYSPRTNSTITEEQSQEFTVSASDLDGGVLTINWYLNGSLVGTGNSYTFTANYTSAGTYELKVIVSDGSLSVNRSWILTVTNVNRPPAIDTIGDKTAYEGQVFNLQISATDMDGDVLTFSDNTTLFDINPATGLISFIPNYDSAGVYFVNITVTDGADIAWQTFKLTIINVNRVPIVINITANPTTVNTGGTATITVDASDEDTEDILTYHYECTGGSISGSGSSVTWTAPDTAGDYTITVYVNDGKVNSNSKSVIITVTSVVENHAPIVNSITANPTTVSTDGTVNITVDATDEDVGDILTYVYSCTGGTISGTGSIVTWTAPNIEGEYTITVYVNDGAANSSSKSIGVTVITVAVDSDGDGYPDDEDAFPNDPAASVDTDNDGYPDEWNPGKSEEDSTTGLKLDAYPNDPTKWELEEEDEEPEKKKEKGFIPAFETAAFFVAMLGVCIILLRKRKKDF